MLAYAIQGLAYGLAAGAQPGPFQTYVISQALSHGWRRTLPAALAPMISDGPIILLVLLMLSQVPERLQRLLHMASGLFILYLAWSAWRAWRSFDVERVTARGSGKQTLIQAALMNALSPGPYLFWSLVAGPTLLAAWRDRPANGLGFLFGFYSSMTLSLAALVLVFGLAKELGPKVSRALLGIAIGALTWFGINQLWLGVTG